MAQSNKLLTFLWDHSVIKWLNVLAVNALTCMCCNSIIQYVYLSKPALFTPSCNATAVKGIYSQIYEVINVI